MIDKLSNRGVNLEGLQIKKGEKSFFWSGKYNIDMNSRDTLITELNVLEHFDPIIPESYQNCDYLMLGNLSPDVQLKVIKRLKNRRSEEHTSELQSRPHLVCRLLLEKKKKQKRMRA